MKSRLSIILFLLVMMAMPFVASAGVCGQNDDVIQLSVHIPGLTQNKGDEKTPCYVLEGGLPQYIAGVYNFGLMVAGFLAMVMIMIGGFMYIAAGGNQTIIGKAKERIFNAIIGLVILLLSYTILNTINPELVLHSGAKRDLDSEKLKKAASNEAATTPSTGGITPGNGPRPTRTQE